MMNKQRFSVVYEEFTSKDIIPKGIMDNKKNNHMCRIEEVCEKLNEQQAEIDDLKEENEQLKNELYDLRMRWNNLKDTALVEYSDGDVKKIPLFYEVMEKLER